MKYEYEEMQRAASFIGGAWSIINHRLPSNHSGEVEFKLSKALGLLDEALKIVNEVCPHDENVKGWIDTSKEGT